VGATVARFGVDRFDTNTATSLGAFGELEIVYQGTFNNADGALVPLRDLFVSQTGNSQGYTNTRSFSILVDQSATNQSSRFQFNWYETGTNTAKNVQVNITTLDIDARQDVKIGSSGLAQRAFAPGSGLQAEDNKIANGLSWTSVYSAVNTNSNFGDPLFAAQLLTTESSTQTLEVGKTAAGNGGFSLFMFEFQTPSVTVGQLTSVTVIPEPSTYVALASLAVLGVAAYRRRRSA
jgi:PEP-CTERM motif